MKKSKLSTGRVDEKESTIKALNAVNFAGRYKQRTLEEYETFLRGLNRAELVNHAHSVGIRVTDDERRAKIVLINEFKENAARLNCSKNVVGPNPEKTELLKRVLELGR